MDSKENSKKNEKEEDIKKSISKKDVEQQEQQEKNPEKDDSKKELLEEKGEKKSSSKKENKNSKNKERIIEMKDVKPGMTVRVYQKIKEINTKGEEKQRSQYFEGVVISRKHGNEVGASITMRKISDGIGVEKIFPIFLPSIEKVVLKKETRVRRAKLYFLKRGYKKRLKEIR